MVHACVQRFDVTGNLEKFYKILGTKQATVLYSYVNILDHTNDAETIHGI
jgi:hypothetical protein